ncbi:hypothetical protein [Nocardioides donggukensis]|uniref:Uncharacterized protein n=1 Tax=Nocardioides donggukensis TaxID=2774019 RepID=A0A927K1I7_9ACTN|nr:hypothetical protein [Nocardioides donggukensis]MBD8868587.1 hypothetical protein [Nocardioides donggukensis]
MTVCPECHDPAEVQWRAVLESTDGPVEHARIQCLRRHWFLLPVATLAAAPAEPGSAPAARGSVHARR